MRTVPDRAKFASWLRQRRLAQTLILAKLAEQGGCSISALKKLAADSRRPSRRLAEQLIDALDVPAHERTSMLQALRQRRHATFLRMPLLAMRLCREAAPHQRQPQRQ